MKKQDIFGHRIMLNYNQQTAYKSTIGGIASVIVKMLVAVYFVI